jgi:hypothetical protein
MGITDGRPQLRWLSLHGNTFLPDHRSLCQVLSKCEFLDITSTPVSNDGLIDLMGVSASSPSIPNSLPAIPSLSLCPCQGLLVTPASYLYMCARVCFLVFSHIILVCLFCAKSGATPTEGTNAGIYMAMLTEARLGCLQVTSLRRLCVGQRFSNLWPDPEWTDHVLEEFKRKRPDVVVCHATQPTDWEGFAAC